jgi:predicted amidophosphoribosyltransferase
VRDDEKPDPETAWTDVLCHRPYNPYRLMGAQNPAFRKATDGRLLDFKDNLDHGIKNAANDLLELLDQLDLPAGTLLVVIPGHEARNSNAGRPLARAAQQIAATKTRFSASVDSLIRTVTIPKLATGGDRDVQTHLKSMTVRQPPNLKGATVVVLDDTVTTGHSVEAARRLLIDAGATRVAAIALGRTVKYF